MGNLILVRHASTDAIRTGRNLGQGADPPLTAEGLRSADRLGSVIAKELSELGATQVRLLASPAQRCRETADGIRSHLADPPSTEAEAGLLEIGYGAWEGLTADQCATRDPRLREAWEADPFNTSTPGGESGAEVAARAFPILDAARSWVSTDPVRAVIVVAHNHVNRLWLTALLGLPMTDYRRRISQDPGCYSVLGFDGGCAPGEAHQRDGRHC